MEDGILIIEAVLTEEQINNKNATGIKMEFPIGADVHHHWDVIDFGNDVLEIRSFTDKIRMTLHASA